MIKFICFLFLMLATSAAQAETMVLFDNTNAVMLRPQEVPEKLRLKSCDRYIFLTGAPEFLPLKDGRYMSKDGDDIFHVSKSCMMPQSGTAVLSDGTPVEFFQEDIKNTNGNLAYIKIGSKSGNDFKPMDDGKYTLDSYEEFSVKDGHLTNRGSYHYGHIGYNGETGF